MSSSGPAFGQPSTAVDFTLQNTAEQNASHLRYAGFKGSFLTDQDIYLFKEGTHYHLFDKLGAHPAVFNQVAGVHFAVWAPNASYVAVIGDFNGWDKGAHHLTGRADGSGIWECFVPGACKGQKYKYFIHSRFDNFQIDKADPYAFFSENPPHTASVIWDLDYAWNDSDWMKRRSQSNSHRAPLSIYEVHLGSWRRKSHEGNRALTYRELAVELVQYLKDIGFTHVEFMPVMEHPFSGSWGYQTTGYFAPTSRHGTPQDFMFLIDALHQAGIGVILDWVPSHFPSDGHGLAYFDGTHLFEHSDPRKGFHPDWKCYVFNNGRNEIKEFLISSAMFWLEKYHADGIRVDAVASMLYLDYSRQEGDWAPNIYGGRENLESIAFIQNLNKAVYHFHPDIQMIAEESTAWGNVSRPVHIGGLGFGMKWNMGWMHDTLVYFSKDPVYRKYHQNDLTFSMLYAYTENFLLSLSHDEVVHGKGSLITKMPNDDWQKFANLRLLFGYMYGHPGKKLIFMGGELAQWSEWRHEGSLDWHLLQYDRHQGVYQWMKDLNHLYSRELALHTYDFEPKGFLWIDAGDWEKSILNFTRRADRRLEDILVVANFTPTPRENYLVGVPTKGTWKVLLNSDDPRYFGSGYAPQLGYSTQPVAYHGHKQSICLQIPPLSVMFLKRETALA
ncbi:MAG: 1,4-alpha-glucan branching protein GlgB [Candidatus Omnitrophica bacterium]|nr:1,4-alpha-glucan branching protein GlgB [Candidatus Omnitrophota bacterium]